MASRYAMDLTQGSVMGKLLRFTIPIILSSLLQQFYSAADTIVIGKFATTEELAAVGSTGSITGLLLNLFMGFSAGVNILCSNLYGSGKRKDLSKCMHTAVLLASTSGIVLAFAGFSLAEPILRWMKSPDNVVLYAARYMKIIFLGVPASFLYNFCAGILNAHGETKRPMYILIVTGFINVLLNLILVIFFRMGVAGVAIATITSQYLSAAAVIVFLFSPRGEYCMQWTRLTIHLPSLKKIVALGLPCGVSQILTDLFNVFFQSNINTFGDKFMAATTAFNSILAFEFHIIVAFGTACISFAGQNYGAKKYERIDTLLKCSILMAAVSATALNLIITLFPKNLLRLYSNDPDVIEIAIPIMLMQGWGILFRCLCAPAAGCLRGMGKTAVTTTSSVLCTIITRLIWLFAVFPFHPTPVFLYVCYPLSYGIDGILMLFLYFRYRKKNIKEIKAI